MQEKKCGARSEARAYHGDRTCNTPHTKKAIIKKAPIQPPQLKIFTALFYPVARPLRARVAV